MASLNKVQVIGRLGKDPEVRSTSGGKAVANFSVAAEESWKDANGERQKKTEWINVVAWGSVVESFIQPYLHKGDLVYIEGKLQTRQWEDKSGGTRYTTEVNALSVQGLVTGSSTEQPKQAKPAQTQPVRPAPAGRPAQAQPAAVGRPPARAAAPHTRQEDSGSANIDDFDIPF